MFDATQQLLNNISGDPDLEAFRDMSLQSRTYLELTQFAAGIIDGSLCDVLSPEMAFILSESFNHSSAPEKNVPEDRRDVVLALLTQTNDLLRYNIQNTNNLLKVMASQDYKDDLDLGRFVNQDGEVNLSAERYGLASKLYFYANQTRGERVIKQIGPSEHHKRLSSMVQVDAMEVTESIQNLLGTWAKLRIGSGSY